MIDKQDYNFEHAVKTAQSTLFCSFSKCEIYAATLTLEGHNNLSSCYVEGGVKLGYATYANKDTQLRHAQGQCDGQEAERARHTQFWLQAVDDQST